MQRDLDPPGMQTKAGRTYGFVKVLKQVERLDVMGAPQLDSAAGAGRYDLSRLFQQRSVELLQPLRLLQLPDLFQGGATA